VRAEAQKQQATDIVRGLAGVREVKNGLAVTQQT
jgi:osmotically-inducible protein OsmY